MGYHYVATDEIEQFDDRPADVRSISTAVGLDYQDSPLGLRVYAADPGDQLPLSYHYHNEQVEVFYVLDGALHIETPEETFVVGTDEAFIVEAGNPHRAHNPADAEAPIRVLAIGAPSVDDAHSYEPDE